MRIFIFLFIWKNVSDDRNKNITVIIHIWKLTRYQKAFRADFSVHEVNIYAAFFHTERDKSNVIVLYVLMLSQNFLNL